MPANTEGIIDAQAIALPWANVTAGTMAYSNAATVRRVVHRFDFTNAQVVALGAVLAGDIKVCTIPADVAVVNVIVVIASPDTSANALTVAVGRTGATYVDYITAQSAKAAAGTVYGGLAAHRGVNNTGGDVPSTSATTDVFAHFIKTTTNLNTVTGLAGIVYIETLQLP